MTDKQQTWPLRWPEGYIPKLDTIAAVEADITECLYDLGKPENLCFHHVFLSNDKNGPHIFVYGKEGSEFLHCEYHESTEWITPSESKKR